jgi:hypothetical protein
MAEHRSLALFLTVLLALGCRGTPQPVTRAEKPQEPKAPAAAPSSPPASEPSAAPAAPPPRQGDAAPVVVDPGIDESNKPQTLLEASRAEKERRANAGKPIAVITDKNLPRYASKGQITVADSKKDKPKAAAPAAAPPGKDEQYWRNRARQLRENWKEAADEVKDLEQKSISLRQKFYGENDTFLRDTQIKPDWDRVLDRLRQARLDVDTAKQELAELLEEGRKEGALPGWLDEGIEDEPVEEPAKKKETASSVQSIEPPVLKEEEIRTPPPGPKVPR